MAHAVDANTIALWRLNEPETGRDYISAKDDRGWQGLTQPTNGDTPAIVGGPSGTSSTTRFARWNESSDYFESASFDKERLRRVLLGPHTIEAWVNPEAIGSNQDLFAWGDVGESVDTNYLHRFRINTSGRLEEFWEYNAGNNGGAAQNVGATVPALDWTHVAIVVDAPTRYEKSYAFDGTNEYVDIGDVSELSFAMTDPFSVSCWVRKTGATFGMIIGKVNSSTDSPALRGWMVNINASGQFEIYLREDGSNGIAVQTTATTFDNGDWYHVVFTYDGSNTVAGLKIYVDGSAEALATTLNAPATTLTNSASVLIGARNTTALEGPWNGAITDVSVWDKELSGAEVTELFGRDHPIDASSSSMSANLVGWWRMGNEPLGTQSRDSLVFGGTNEYVNFGFLSEYNFAKTDPFSVSCWFKTSSGSGFHTFVTNQEGASPFNGWLLGIDCGASGIVVFQLRATITGPDRIFVRSSTGLNDGNWHHVVATYDGSNNVSGFTLIVDGVDDTASTTGTSVSGSISSAAPFQIGGTDSAIDFLVGSLSHIAVYDKELTSGEATTLYGNRNPPNLTSAGPTANLIGYWPMQGSPSAPISTKSVLFGGTDEYASAGIVSALNFGRTRAFSVSAWVKVSSSPNAQDQVVGNIDSGSSQGWGLLLDWGALGLGAGRAAFRFGDGTNTIIVGSSAPVDDGGWHHLAATYDGSAASSGVIFYVDGVAVTTDAGPSTLTGTTQSADSLDFGALTQSLFSTMAVDEVSIYDGVLSASAVARIYNEGYPVDLLVDAASSSLLAWWRMGDSDTFPTLRDSSGNRYHATMYNMESGDLATDAPGQYPNVYDLSSSSHDGTMVNMETTDISRYSGVTQQLFPRIPDESPSENEGLMVNMESADLLTDSSVPLCDIHWYINGSLEDSDTDVIWAEGGGTGTFYVFSELSGSTAFVGRCFEMRISSVARTTPEILANAQATDYEHPLDADTAVLWRLNEEPEASDSSGNGWHLGPYLFNSASAVNLPVLAPSLTEGDSGYSRKFLGYTNAANCSYYLPRAGEMVPLLMGAAEWTLEFWFLWGDRLQGGDNFASFGSTGETSQTNFGLNLLLQADGRFNTFWENGSGNNVTLTTADPVIDPANPADANFRHHIAFVKESNGGGTSNVLIYKDGVLVESLGPMNDSSGGESGFFVLGGNADQTTAGIDGLMDDVRLSSVARSAAEVLASYEAGIGGTGTLTTEYFKMRGVDQTCPSQPTYIYWVVQDAPDLTAAQLDPGDLPCGTDPSTDVIDIEIAMTWRE
jgi:hypothetical protein